MSQNEAHIRFIRFEDLFAICSAEKISSLTVKEVRSFSMTLFICKFIIIRIEKEKEREAWSVLYFRECFGELPKRH